MERQPLALIVDDDPSSRLIIKKAIKQNMFDVVEAENGIEAVTAFGAHLPDLVLLDVFMPQMDGFEACRRIRAHPNGVTVPVVIITAADDFQSIDKAYEAGATDFLAKPITPRILNERIRYIHRASETANKLHQNQELLARAQAVAALGSFSFDAGSSILKVSEEFQILLGTSDTRGAFPWDTFWQKIHPEDQKTLLPFLQRARMAGDHFRRDIRILGGRDGERHFMLQVDPQKNSEGNIVTLVGIIQDITERKLSELFETDQNDVMQMIIRKEPLKEVFLKAARLLERQRPLSHAGICHVEDSHIQAMISPSLPDQFCQAITGTSLSAHNGTCAAAAHLGQPANAENITTSSFWKNSREKALDHGFYSSSAVPVFSGTGKILGTVGMMQRNTHNTTNADMELMKRVANLVALAAEQEHLSSQMIYQAQHDHLTGLINRGTLNHFVSKNLKKILRTPSSGAYMIIDLDRFKRINDLLGHHLGDKLLQEVAERLRQCVRESDILSRVGGDEFVVILTEIKNKQDAMRSASRILASFKKPFTIDGHRLSIEASIGITIFPQDAADEIALYKNADVAMYVAKNEGGDRFHFFDYKMHEAMLYRLEIENDLRKALERNEFELEYQPQMDLAANRLMAMEALIRWNHPDKGRIQPTRFISVAEESRLINPIGRWVLSEACRQNKAWQEEGFSPVRVAVNVSAVQFTETDFAKIVQETLAETGLHPCWLEIEITESVLLKDLQKTSENLQKLKQIGVTTTLDDFGTGYSSITYLSNMPLDGIKIDQSFIRDMEINSTGSDCKNANFVKAFATLAENLHLNMVAEGIETIKQKQLLMELGYKTGQGFLFSVPLPANKASEFLVRPLNNSSAEFSGDDHTSRHSNGKE